ncbi:MAG: acyl-[acyl-carrier-protein]--UDP-N-acetylglucosamine O-acyltransferase [Bdellovibrionales bacterium CG12_big_fil_rev_8_21_14_0_65_38_15]|nr:MAG: acyl-[acyl-carrier-protein]--UDP-N-acetylglucosamine O-acyltransferase [Bdellovibrionales bacterium CG22_combo_CG10-13_8_21_14_all_38_13]PIQ54717.1 MAG: acyl-[acyl-carrier-protein]--UDP-N-acetylglucosamine O-acyltransferase [Bdellovibrionales bacterium CG12_big_fil_rev_8_21_14_0_65_38_15]PIR30865.1 MAG: acyl-[acyl-carrier-protein]--UDP-N-acetylglucosamine O-acyltransferase [Bdellovibrionales bacterium CG11_big_fil_rev_8_21_14_0_20_38_13]
MSVSIHPSAIVSPEAKIAPNVSIGPFSIIGPNVEISTGCIIGAQVHIDGHTKIGENNRFESFCSIGAAPQDTSYKGEPTQTVIGSGNTFREYVSVHRGTLKDNGITNVGNNSLFMAYVHLGHDVQFGSNCVVANSTNFAGHVKVGDRVIIGGGSQISQFVSIGRGAYIGGATAIDRDIPIFCTAYGNRVKLKGVNIIGMRRQGVEKAAISEVLDFYRTMEASALSPRAFVEHEEHMAEFKDNVIISEMVSFIRVSEVGIAPFL